MRKYWHVLGIGMQNTLVYRMNFFFRAAFGLIPLIATIQLWKAIYEGKPAGEVAGYTLAEMISYYLVVLIVDALTAVAEDDWQIAADIREGTISQFLMKPVNYFGYRLCLFWSGRLVYTAAALIPVAGFLFLQKRYLIFPDQPETLVIFGVSLVMTGLLQFFISFSLALMAFWVLEVSTLIFIVFAFEYIAGGHLFPLDILPPHLASILQFTPFPYQLFFPVEIYLEKTTGRELWFGLGMQFFWVLLFFLVALLVWKRGIRKYAAFGG